MTEKELDTIIATVNNWEDEHQIKVRYVNDGNGHFDFMGMTVTDDGRKELRDAMTEDEDKPVTRAERIEQSLAQQLARSIKFNSRLQSRNSLLRKAVENINAAASNGRICKDVAWYDTATTLQDFCEQVLTQDETLRTQGDKPDEATAV